MVHVPVQNTDRSLLNIPLHQGDISLEKRLNVTEVADLLSIGISTVWKFASDGRLPKPERYGSHCTRWRLGTLLEAIEKLNEGGGHV